MTRLIEIMIIPSKYTLFSLEKRFLIKSFLPDFKETYLYPGSWGFTYKYLEVIITEGSSVMTSLITNNENGLMLLLKFTNKLNSIIENKEFKLVMRNVILEE